VLDLHFGMYPRTHKRQTEGVKANLNTSEISSLQVQGVKVGEKVVCWSKKEVTAVSS
jgi:hypothetical protein